LAKFIISEEGQNLIANFTKGGETLFKPMARSIELARTLGFPEQEKEIAWYDAQNPEAFGERELKWRAQVIVSTPHFT
jgi:ABC-type Fe3+ transport system substrate-binding protein